MAIPMWIAQSSAPATKAHHAQPAAEPRARPRRLPDSPATKSSSAIQIVQ
jgi:hypothetical protein